MTPPPATNTDVALARIRDVLLGGFAVGSAGGIATSLGNHFNSLNRRAEDAKDPADNNDVLYVNVPHQKAAMVGTDALALTSFPVGAVGGYQLVRQMYEHHKRIAAQKELEESQNAYVDALNPEATKEAASWPMSGTEAALAALPALMLATGVGSGVLTNSLLERHFPAPRPPDRMMPKRLVVRETPEDDGMIKEQSVREDTAAAGLLSIILAIPEAAEASGLGDLVKAASEGRTEEILAASDISSIAMFETVRGAVGSSDPLRKEAAVAWLVREPELGPAIKLAAAIEFRNAFPLFCSVAAAAPTDWHEDLVKLAADYYRLELTNRYGETEKSAAAVADLLGLREGLEDSPPGTVSGEDSNDPSPTQIMAQPAVAPVVDQHLAGLTQILNPNGVA